MLSTRGLNSNLAGAALDKASWGRHRYRNLIATPLGCKAKLSSEEDYSGFRHIAKERQLGHAAATIEVSRWRRASCRRPQLELLRLCPRGGRSQFHFMDCVTDGRLWRKHLGQGVLMRRTVDACSFWMQKIKVRNRSQIVGGWVCWNHSRPPLDRTLGIIFVISNKSNIVTPNRHHFHQIASRLLNNFFFIIQVPT